MKMQLPNQEDIINQSTTLPLMAEALEAESTQPSAQD
ncbi:hypothetical protein V6Z11_A11G287100 [Gossypium hirsutum]